MSDIDAMSEQLKDLIYNDEEVIALYNDQLTAGNPSIVQCAILVATLRMGLRFYGDKFIGPAPQETFVASRGTGEHA
jgi:hypothetical protein